MRLLTRVRLFARDWWQEFPVAWSLARMRDCERRGGHPWGAIEKDDVLGPGKTCRRCGCFESAPRTVGTGSTTVWLGSTTGTES